MICGKCNVLFLQRPTVYVGGKPLCSKCANAVLDTVATCPRTRYHTTDYVDVVTPVVISGSGDTSGNGYASGGGSFGGGGSSGSWDSGSSDSSSSSSSSDSGSSGSD